MAQGQFTKEEAQETQKALNEMFRALSAPKRQEFLGHFNDISLFLTAAQKVAPDEAP